MVLSGDDDLLKLFLYNRTPRPAVDARLAPGCQGLFFSFLVSARIGNFSAEGLRNNQVLG